MMENKLLSDLRDKVSLIRNCINISLAILGIVNCGVWLGWPSTWLVCSHVNWCLIALYVFSLAMTTAIKIHLNGLQEQKAEKVFWSE